MGLLASLAELVLRMREDSRSWLARDADLNYKLSSALDGVNSLGVRHPEEIGPHDAARGFRILVIGDSVAWDRDGFVARLRERLLHAEVGRVEVINAAVPGCTTYQQRVFLERDLEALGADLVLHQYCLNDNHRFLHEIGDGGRWVISSAGEGARAHTPWWRRSALLRRVARRLRADARARSEAVSSLGRATSSGPPGTRRRGPARRTISARSVTRRGV